MTGVTDVPHIHLRAETKPHEERSPLTPEGVKELRQAGYHVTVERSTDRCFSDNEYEEHGAEMVDYGSWTTQPKGTFILGLKELPEDEFDLEHKHIYFGHCYKGQSGAEELLKRFQKGGGSLLDHEFLVHDDGRRMAAFSYYAGFVGAAVGTMVYSHQVHSPNVPFPALSSSYHEKQLLVDAVGKMIKDRGHAKPRLLVLGALGKCGSGACDFASKLGMDVTKWDIAETSAKPGPYQELLEYDMVLNCILLQKKIPPFLTKDMLNTPDRNLRVLVDVSCDVSSPNNPLPFVRECSTFSNPAIRLDVGGKHPFDIVSIDHLPTLTPKDASRSFANELLPALLQLKDNTTIWQRTLKTFHGALEKLKFLPK